MMDVEPYLGLKAPASGPVTRAVFLELLGWAKSGAGLHWLRGEPDEENLEFFLRRAELAWLDLFFDIVVDDKVFERRRWAGLDSAYIFGVMAGNYPEQGLTYLLLLLGDARYRAMGIEALEYFEHPSRQIGLDYLTEHEAEFNGDCRRRWRRLVAVLEYPDAWWDWEKADVAG